MAAHHRNRGRAPAGARPRLPAAVRSVRAEPLPKDVALSLAAQLRPPRGRDAAAERQARAEAPLVKAGLIGPNAGPPGEGPAALGVNTAGGEIVQRLQPRSLMTYEELFTALPDEGMFSPALNPGAPFQFELGSFIVPNNQTLWLTDYRCGVLLFDAVGPGDYRVAEDGRFRGVMGFDLRRSGSRMGRTSYQLDPVPIQAARSEFEEVILPSGAPAGGKFNRNAASSFASVAGQGTALLPVWSKVMGPRDGIWTWIIEEDDRVSVSCVIFRPIPVPIAGVFARLAGHLVYVDTARAVQERTRPR